MKFELESKVVAAIELTDSCSQKVMVLYDIHLISSNGGCDQFCFSMVMNYCTLTNKTSFALRSNENTVIESTMEFCVSMAMGIQLTVY